MLALLKCWYSYVGWLQTSLCAVHFTGTLIKWYVIKWYGTSSMVPRATSMYAEVKLCLHYSYRKLSTYNRLTRPPNRRSLPWDSDTMVCCHRAAGEGPATSGLHLINTTVAAPTMDVQQAGPLRFNVCLPWRFHEDINQSFSTPT